jgi:hypothetical protein
VLRPIGARGRAIAAVRSAPAGPFRLTLPLGSARPGRYRLALTASGRGGIGLGPAVTAIVRVGALGAAMESRRPDREVSDA